MEPKRHRIRIEMRTRWYCDLHAEPSVAFVAPNRATERKDERFEGRIAIYNVGVHDGRSQSHLSNCVCKTGHSRCLTEEVGPSYDPRPDGNMLLRNDMLGDEVHSASSWIRRYQLGDCVQVSSQ